MFTFSDEIDALCELEKYKEAWRQLRLREDVIYGRRFDIASAQGPFDNPYELEWHYAPLLFFVKRYEEGCSLLETALDVRFVRHKLDSYDVLFRVYNDDERPWHRCRVTLSHFYGRLGKNLVEWRRWEAFVYGFHPKLFRLAGVSRKQLLADAGRLPDFFDTLLAIREERVPTRISKGLADLIDSPRKVKSRQNAIRKASHVVDERNDAKRKRRHAKLRELFPELRELLK
ncbi:MAG TPA: hypothetical protein VGH74_17500 [Planctomycetaceae bacterium]